MTEKVRHSVIRRQKTKASPVGVTPHSAGIVGVGHGFATAQYYLNIHLGDVVRLHFTPASVDTNLKIEDCSFHPHK